MDTNTEKIKMLHEAVHEMAMLLQDSNENPVSLSLYLLDLGITDSKVKDKLIKKTFELVHNAQDPMALTAHDFQKEFHKISNLITDDPDATGATHYIVLWIGMHLIPRVYPVAMNL